MITFFEVISVSAPHIYHSALPLSPKTSIIHRQYDLYAQSFSRVVQGLPATWEPAVSAPEPHNSVITAAWSPCSRFIAAARSNPFAIEILDSVTLERLNTFKSPYMNGWLSFSPDGHLLAGFGITQELTWELVSWDLQTGCPVSTIPSELDLFHANCFLSAHSTDGKMVAVAYGKTSTTITAISIYDLFSGIYTHSHHIPEGHTMASIWTHGECVQYVTLKPGLITIWEVGYTSMNMPTMVKSLPAPNNIDCSGECLFLPALSRLAFTCQGGVLVWDVRNSKLLLNFLNIHLPIKMSFSPNGHIFAYGTLSEKIYLWTESPTGYILQKVISTSSRDSQIGPLPSPNGESIIVPNDRSIQLWHIVDLPLSTPSIPTKRIRPADFALEFTPGETLAAAARIWENRALVLNLRSGNLRLAINVGMKIAGLGVTESTITIVGEKKIVTWNLPMEDCAPNSHVNINDSCQTTMFDSSAHPSSSLLPMSVSPDLNFVAIPWDTFGKHPCLKIHDISTGRCLASIITRGHTPWFTPDGCEVWCRQGNSDEGWSIIKDVKSDLMKFEPLGPAAQPSGGFPWQSLCGYRIICNEWVVNSSGKRLLWLPHHWRPDERQIKWSGQFLGLQNPGPSEAVILEFNE